MTRTRVRTSLSWQGAAVGVLALACTLLVATRLNIFSVFWASWLGVWWVLFSIIMGVQVNVWLHGLSGGAWGEGLQTSFDDRWKHLLGVALLLIPLAAGMRALYPWASPGWAPGTEQPAFQAIWLHPGAVMARVAVGLVALTLVLRPAAKTQVSPVRASVAGLLVWTVVVSLLGVDLLMSLLPQWYSSGFGFVLLAAQVKLGLAWCIVWSAPRVAAPVRRDLGNLLLAWVMMWAYLAWSQFQIIWAENLPPEISAYQILAQPVWRNVGVMMVGGGFFLPLALLLFRPIKEHAGGLRATAALVLAMGVAEILWWVLPYTTDGRSLRHVIWLVPLVGLGMAALLVGAVSLSDGHGRVPKRARVPAPTGARVVSGKEDGHDASG